MSMRTRGARTGQTLQLKSWRSSQLRQCRPHVVAPILMRTCRGMVYVTEDFCSIFAILYRLAFFFFFKHIYIFYFFKHYTVYKYLYLTVNISKTFGGIWQLSYIWKVRVYSFLDSNRCIILCKWIKLLICPIMHLNFYVTPNFMSVKGYQGNYSSCGLTRRIDQTLFICL